MPFDPPGFRAVFAAVPDIGLTLLRRVGPAEAWRDELFEPFLPFADFRGFPDLAESADVANRDGDLDGEDRRRGDRRVRPEGGGRSP